MDGPRAWSCGPGFEVPRRLFAAIALCAPRGGGAGDASRATACREEAPRGGGAACLVARGPGRRGRGGGGAAERCRNGLASAFAKAEAKPPCDDGDASEVQSRVDAFADDAGAALDPGAPNACQAAKLRSAATAARCLLQLEAKQAAQDVAPPAAKLERCRHKLAAAFERAERKPVCATTGDAPATGPDRRLSPRPRCARDPGGGLLDS
jgi:hypothetical protein